MESLRNAFGENLDDEKHASDEDEALVHDPSVKARVRPEEKYEREDSESSAPSAVDGAPSSPGSPEKKSPPGSPEKPRGPEASPPDRVQLPKGLQNFLESDQALSFVKRRDGSAPGSPTNSR